MNLYCNGTLTSYALATFMLNRVSAAYPLVGFTLKTAPDGGKLTVSVTSAIPGNKNFKL